MSGDLVIRMGREGRAIGHAFTDGGQTRIGKGAEPSRDDIKAARRVLLVVPGQDVVCHTIKLPVRAENEARKAVRFALEDRLAEPADKLHFALGEASPSGSRMVAVTGHGRLRQWLDHARDLGASIDAIVADHRCYARAAEGPGLVQHLGGVSLIGQERSATVDLDLAGLAASRWFDGSGAVSALADDEALVELARARSWQRMEAPDPADDLRLLARYAGEEAAHLNLLQGAYRQALGWFDDWRFWRLAACVWAVAGLAYAAMLGAEAYLLDQRAAQMRANATEIARTELPQGTRIVDARRQMQAALQTGQAGTGGDLVPLTAAMMRALQSDGGVRIDGLRYDGAARQLAINVSYTDYDELAALRSRLEEAGVNVREGAARQSGGMMLGEVTLSWR